MDKKIYTNAEINAALRGALDEKGEDYTYSKENTEACLYKRAGEPSCIVGHVLHALDPEMFERVAAFERDPETKLDTTFHQVARQLHLPFNEEQVRALRYAQIVQDNGGTWSNAVAEWNEIIGENA